MDEAPRPFAPFTDFDATPDQARTLHELLHSDMSDNLATRYAFFLYQDQERALRTLGFVPTIAEHGFSPVGVLRDDAPNMVYSVGFHYTLGLPDLILLDLDDVGTNALEAVIVVTGQRLLRANHELSELSPLDRAKLVARTVRKVCERFDLPVQRVVRASRRFLQANPYGYGHYFYSHFMDTPSVPLVAARIGR